MVVGICQIELRLPSSRSLKDKRQLIKGLTRRLKDTYNISLAETGYRDLRQRAAITIACISTSDYQAKLLASAIEREIECKDGVEVIDRRFVVADLDATD